MKEAGKQACRSLLTGMVLLAGVMLLSVSSSCASAAPSAEQSGQIATVEQMLEETQNSIWKHLHSQEVDALAQQLRAAEKAGRDDQAGQLRLRLNQLEKRLLGDAPADGELARLVRKKKMLLDELARLGGGTPTAASSAVAAAALTAGTSTITGKVTGSDGPIKEAGVWVVDSSGNGESFPTDAAGVYTVANIAAGTYCCRNFNLTSFFPSASLRAGGKKNGKKIQGHFDR